MIFNMNMENNKVFLLVLFIILLGVILDLRLSWKPVSKTLKQIVSVHWCIEISFSLIGDPVEHFNWVYSWLWYVPYRSQPNSSYGYFI